MKHLLLQLLPLLPQISGKPLENPTLRQQPVDQIILHETSPVNHSGSSSNISSLTKHITSYTALGDSYSSGFSAGPPLGSTCDRSTAAYAYQFAQRYSPSHFQFSACGGATAARVRSEQINAADSNFGHPELVSLTMGGNDGFLFPSIAVACIYGPRWDDAFWKTWFWEVACWSAMTAGRVTVWMIGGALEDAVQDAVRHGQEEGEERLVVVLGYPRPWNIERDCPRGDAGEQWLGFPSRGKGGQRDRMNGLVEAMNRRLREAASSRGAVYQDVDEAFEGHRLCDVDEAFLLWNICDANRSDLGCVAREGVLHPTADGHLAYRDRLAEAVGLI